MTWVADKLELNLSTELTAKAERLTTILTEMSSVLVAYSGGVDSALVLKMAYHTLGSERAAGCLAVSPSVPPREVELARRHAAEMSARLIVTQTREMEREGYVENSPDRCYFCKNTLYTELVEVADREGLAWIADGFNLDDRGDHRPGQRAGKELNVRSPLVEAGFTKRDIRDLSRAWGLPTWNKPAAACLSSRIPYGTPVTVEALERIGKAEEALQDLGFAGGRVRHHGEIARIEVPAADVARLAEENNRRAISEALHKLGYAFVALDLDGYRTGSLNELIFHRRKL